MMGGIFAPGVRVLSTVFLWLVVQSGTADTLSDQRAGDDQSDNRSEDLIEFQEPENLTSETTTAESADVSTDYAGEPVLLDKVVVTGQKLTRDLQLTPDSVTVLTSDDLREAGVEDLRDAFRLAPNIDYSPSNNGNNGFTIRGINSEGVGAPGTNQQPLSSLVIDGAVQSLEGVRKGARGIWDVQSVEVLRGPQISQGRNALVGAVIVKTNDPSFDYEVNGQMALDTQGEERAVTVNAPLNDQLSFRFSAESIEKNKDINYSDPNLSFLADEDYYSFRAKMLFMPDVLPNFSALLTWSRAHDDPAITAVSGPDYFQRRLTQAFDGIETRVNDVDNVVLDLTYLFDSGIEVKSVSTLTETVTRFEAPSPSFDRDETREDLDISQDFRASYQSDDGRLSVLVGGFYGNYRNNRDSLVRALIPEVVTTEREVTLVADSCTSLNFDADGEGRWYDFFSDAYAQINQGFNGNPATDGFFQISSPGTQIGGGADVFPFESAWDDVGAVYYDLSAFSGTGTESVPITGGTFDFSKYAADDDTVTNLGYTTTVTVNSGSATFVDGTLSDMQANFNVNFEYTGFPAWTGTLILGEDGTFTLDAGDLSAAIGTINFAWDFDGTYSASATTGSCPDPGKTVTQTIREQTLTGNYVFDTIQNFASVTRRHNYAAYTEMDWRFHDNLRFIAGLRYDYEETGYTETNRSTQAISGGDASFDAFLPKMGLIVDVTSDVSVGFVVSRGYRSGFIDRGNKADAVINTVNPEFLWSYEVPLRTQWLDGRLRANANFFYYDWTNQQISVVDPTNTQLTRTVNAGKSESFGAEFDLRYRPLTGLTLGASVGLLKTRFKDFTTDVGDFSGNEFPEAPNVSGSVTANYYAEQGWFVGGDVTYRSSVFATSDLANQDNLKIKGRTLVNLHAGYEDPAGRFRVMGEIRNLLDLDYLTGRDINSGAYIGDPIVFGLTGELNY